jgi:hypothetical protein
VNPFVFGLDAACAFVFTKIILKRTKADKGFFLLASSYDKPLQGDELPAFEIDMAFSGHPPMRFARQA